MKKLTRSIFLFALLVMMSAFSITSYAEPGESGDEVKLDYRIMVYDTFKFYISESDTEVGELILDGSEHIKDYTGNTFLKPGKTYYLHIYAQIQGITPHFAGRFNLTGSGLKFSNNSNELLTNPTDFRAYSNGVGNGLLKTQYNAMPYKPKLPGVTYIDAVGAGDRIWFSTTIVPDQSILTAQASGANNGVNITWNSIPDVISYSVERSITAGGPYNPIASDLTETSYTDNSTVANNTYYYIVKAKLSDTETITSTEVSATPTNETPTIDSKLKVVLEPEEKLQLSVDDHLDENTNMAWTSSNSTVAQVDANGVVTAIKAGDAVIHVQSPDGNYSDDINILVVDNADDYRLAIDLKVGKTTRLTVDNLTNTLNVAWESSDTTVATVSSKGVVTAKGKGLTLAKATDREGNVVGQVYIRVRD
ncbi:hypothetical protein LXJ15735_03510 [Lacrimispora xylanolytica]